MTYNALAAMVTQAYMAYTGTTIEQVAAVCVACRKWAMLQPNAMFNKKEITVEKVLSSRMVAYPLTAFMCNVLADGGTAFIMTTAEKAKKVCDKPAYILSDSSSYSHRTITRSKSRDLNKMGEAMTPVAREAYERAGLGPEDMDIYQIYGSYPVLQLIVMDALGICEPGKSGALVESGETSPGGKYPVTTNGRPSPSAHRYRCGHRPARRIGAAAAGQGGRGTVEGAKFLIENTGGGAFMDCHFTILGKEIPG